MNVKQYLQERRVPFTVIPHPQVFDASHLAEAVHTPGREVAKAVLFRANHDYRHLVAVLPSTHVVDVALLSKALGNAELRLATEQDVAQLCPDCELGVLSPFGSCYGAMTVVDSSLSEDEDIVFEGNTHSEAIRMKYRDYYRIEQPLVAHFARRAAETCGENV
jgi:Ala-tRNA(Pro) deacylase